MAVLGLTLAVLSCSDLPTAVPLPDPEPKSGKMLGVVVLRVNVVGPGEVRTSASFFKADAAGMPGPRFTLSDADFIEGDVSGPLFESLPGAGSFTHGPPGAGGYRYGFMSVRVRNAGINSVGDTVGFTTARQNLTMIPIEVPEGGGFEGIPGTPFADLQKFDGTPADPAIAEGIAPTGAVRQTLTGDITTHSPDVLQVFTEEEVAVASGFGFFDPFPYGFMIHHVTETDTRTLAANPGPDQWDGIMTLGLKIPLQANPADDVYGFAMAFVLRTDSETRITQSIEEQDAAGQAAFEARVASLASGPDGVDGVTLLDGGSYGGSVAVPIRRLCSVRIAGTVAAPVAFLGDPNSTGDCPPTLSSVSPAFALPGTTVSVTLTGAHFVDGATTVAVSGAGVTVENVDVVNATSLTADFVIDAGAAETARNVTVTTAGGTSGARIFSVAPPQPTLTGINPASGARGSAVEVTLTGTNFVAGATSVAVSGTGVFVDNDNLSVTSSTTLAVFFVIDCAAELGNHDVTVTTAGGTSGAQTFTVDPNPNCPTLTGINPASGKRSDLVTVTLTGTNFVAGAGATTVLVSGSGVAVNNVTFVSSTELTADFTIDGSATLGARDVRVATAVGASGAQIFTVNPGSAIFEFTGGVQTFIVPTGVTSITVEVAGAQGGANDIGEAGANGGTVTATGAIDEGDELKIFVGGQGGASTAGSGGGFNGGGAGGTDAGGGGGASDVRFGGIGLENRGVVAGGGGGRSGTFAGGAGGGLTGGAGLGGADADDGFGGGGGTQLAGGAGGTDGPDTDGAPGDAGGGIGGAGGLSALGGTAGGGGGGGYYGGGGGEAGLPGGGGGGGSSFAPPGATHTQGNRPGHGRVVITW